MIYHTPVSSSSPAVGSKSYVRWPNKSLDDLESELEGLRGRGESDSVTLGVSSGGQLVSHQPEGEDSATPVTLAQLSRALDEIGEREPWVMDRNGVSIYKNEAGVHVDVVSFAGFILKDDGGIASRSVNPW